MLAEIFLYSAYYLVSLLYLASGVFLLVQPDIVERYIPKLFPLLAHFRLQRLGNAFNLIVVGVILLLTAEYLVEKEFIGFFIALVLSVWEVYLSMTFYRKHHSRFDVWSHFWVHIVIVVFVGWLLLSDYGQEIAVLRDIWSAALSPSAEGLGYFLGLLHEHILAAAFFICLFGGEPAVLVFSFLAGQGKMDPLTVTFIGFTTAFLGEWFWFLTARTRLFNFVDRFLLPENHGHLFGRIQKTLDNAPFKAFFLARFISGITIPCIVYFGRKRIDPGKFFLYCLIVNSFWAPIVTLIGWSAGLGFTLVLETFKSLQIAVNVTLFGILFVYLIYRHISRKAMRASTDVKLGR